MVQIETGREPSRGEYLLSMGLLCQRYQSHSALSEIVSLVIQSEALDVDVCNLQPRLQGILRNQPQMWTKISSKQHTQENAQATLHPHKEI